MTNELEMIQMVQQRKLNRAILDALRDGPLRYSQLNHAVAQASPITVHSKTLTATLNYLRTKGLVERRGERRNRIYRLTSVGTHLVDLVNELKDWRPEHRTDTDTDTDDDL